MASPIKISTADLRSASKEYQRDRNHNAKWARGFTTAPGKRCLHIDNYGFDACTECGVRPQHRDGDRRCGRHFSSHNGNRKSIAQKATIARKVFRNELSDTGIGSSDSSGSEEECREAVAAAAADPEVMYSYDATHGPGKGTDILSHAVTKAVQRYETKVTEKLVKEYEFVDSGREFADGYNADADEDDFEMIDHAGLE